MKKTISIVLFGTLFLSNCSGMDVMRSTKPNTVVNAEGPTGVGYGTQKVGSLVQAFERDYLIAFCLSGGVVEVKTTDEKAKLKKNAACDLLFEGVSNYQNTSAVFMGLNESTAAKRMTQSGFRLTKAVCTAYFKRIGDQGQDSDFYQKFTNTVGGVSSAVLGLTGSPAKSVALTATGFSGLLAGLESFDEVYHFTPDRQVVLDLIIRSLNSYEAEIIALGEPETYNEAIEAIQGYQMICQTDYIKKTVNDAISQSKIRTYSATNRTSLVRTSLSGTDRQTLAVQLGTKTLNDDQILTLFKVYLGKAQSPSDLKKVFSELQYSNLGLILKATDADGKETYSIDTTVLSKVNEVIDNFSKSHPQLYDKLSDAADSGISRASIKSAGSDSEADSSGRTIVNPPVIQN